MPKANPNDQKITLSHLAKHFSDEGKAYELVERLRWPEGQQVCPHCGSIRKHYFLRPRTPDRYTRTGHTTQRRVWKCADCRKQFSVLIGTIFEDSRVPLSKWLLAIHMLCAAKNGVSSTELARTLEITQKSAWFMAHRIRLAMEREPLAGKLSGVVEADETYIGAQVRGKGKGPKIENETPVLTLVERNGEARSRALDRVTRVNVRKHLADHVAEDPRLMAEENNLYIVPGRKFASHKTVDHHAREYARGDVHINTAEGYFSQLKRSIDGTHHHVSRQHLHRDLSEFDHRYNTRKEEDGERTVRTMKQSEGNRLRYRQPEERE